MTSKSHQSDLSVQLCFEETTEAFGIPANVFLPMLEVSWFHRFPSIIDIEHQPNPVSRQAIQKDATAAPEDGDEEMNSMQSSGAYRFP